MSPHFVLFGVPVRVHGMFWLMAMLFGGLGYARAGLLWAIPLWLAVVFSAVLLHEMGHALVGRRFGLAPEVHLTGLGGQTVWVNGRLLTHGRSVLVSFAGPAVGLAIGGAAQAFLALFPGPLPMPVTLVLDDVVFTNLGWALFNLLPVPPLDGGQIVIATLDRFFGVRGQRAARVVGMLAAAACVALAIALRPPQIFVAVFMAMLAYQNFRAWQLQAQWSEGLLARARRPARPPGARPEPIDADVRAAWQALEEGDAATVRRMAESLLLRASSDDERYEVAHLLAWGRLLGGDPEGAARALRHLPPGKLPDALLEGSLLLELGRPAQAVAPLAEAIVGRNDDFVSMRLARAVARSARTDEVRAILGDPARASAVGARALQIVVQELFYAGLHRESAELGALLFERFRDPRDAFNVACALGQAGRAEEAIPWLERALDAGLSDPTVLDTDADLAPVRQLPAFRELRTKAGLVR